MFQRKPAETPPNSPEFPEYLTQATWEQYTLWLEGYLVNGGDSASFYGKDEFFLWDPNRWIGGTALATGDYDEDAISDQQYCRVIVPEHVTDTPPVRSLYMLATDTVEGHADVPIYPLPQFRECTPLFAKIFTDSLSPQLKTDANPEHQGVFGGYWPNKREQTLQKYSYLAKYFDIDLPDTLVQTAIRQAVEFRRGKEREMATPEYQERQLEAAGIMLELSKRALSSDEY